MADGCDGLCRVDIPVTAAGLPLSRGDQAQAGVVGWLQARRVVA